MAQSFLKIAHHASLVAKIVCNVISKNVYSVKILSLLMECVNNNVSWELTNLMEFALIVCMDVRIVITLIPVIYVLKAFCMTINV